MKRKATLLVLLALGVAVAVGTGVYFQARRPAVGHKTPAPASPPPVASSTPPAPVPVRPRDVDTLVRLFFSSLKDGKQAAAYACLSPALQKTIGYQAFAAEFKDLAAYDISSLRVVGAGNFSLVVQVPYTIAGHSRPHVATLQCVNLTGGYGPPDWKVQSLSTRPAAGG